MSDVKYRIGNDTVAGARKPGNDMKKRAGLPKMGDNPATWQTADRDLGFNGQEVTEQRAGRDRWAYNQHRDGFKNPDMIQERQMPIRKGYAESYAAGRRTAPATAGASKNPVESGGRSWKPEQGQNYRGNPDKIQDRQMYNRVGNKD
jgi:hypothetical protein